MRSMLFHVLRPGRCLRHRGVALAALLVVCTLARGASAQDPDAAVQRMIELNRKALTSYQAKDFEGAKQALLEAVVAGKEAGLANDRMIARTYVHLGAVYVDCLQDLARGVRYLVNAIKIRPDINITPSLVTPTLTDAFAEAKREAANPAAPPEAAA